jgi:signal transduction histidine kinase
MLDDLGLGPAIEWQVQEFQKRTGIASEVENRLECPTLDRGRSTALFRVIQETLTNIYRHAEATQAKVTLEENGGELVATIMDNGRGISQKQLSDPASLGLIGIRERVHYYGGRVTIDKLPQGGTRVLAAIPLGKTNGKEQVND